MPSFCAAAQISVPGGTLTGRPSIVRFTRSCSAMMRQLLQRGVRAARLWPHEAGVRPHGVRVFVAEELDAAHDARGCRVARWAERLAGDVVADVVEQIRVPPPAVPLFEPLQQLHQPERALATGCALAAGFVAR